MSLRIAISAESVTPGLATVALALIATSAFAQGLPKLEWSYPDGSKVGLYGQIDKGVLTYDDGGTSETYGLIDNDNADTRLGVTYDRGLADGWDYRATIELRYAPFSTGAVSILQPTPPPGAWDFTNANIRQLDNRFKSARYGTVYVGQGEMASDKSAEVDLSGTTVVAYSEVEDSAAAQLFRQTNGALSTIAIRDAFDNFDGLGRDVRLRYDTPKYKGFGLRASYGRNLLSESSKTRNENLYDIAATYAKAIENLEIAAAIAYSWQGDDTTIFDGSGSALHRPTGLSLTAAAGTQDDGDLVGSYGYVKLGWQRDLVSWGKTAFAVDHYAGMDIAAKGSTSESTAVIVVQAVPKYGIELWLTYRRYSYDDDAAEYDDGKALFGGARFQF